MHYAGPCITAWSATLLKKKVMLSPYQVVEASIRLRNVRDPTLYRHRLTDCGKIVIPTHRPRSTLQKHFMLLVLISVRG
jgi:hypothetical protein